MYILTVCLSPEEMEDDPNLLSIKIEDTSQETVLEAISSRYDIDKESFHYYEYGSMISSGNFETVDVDDDEDEEDGFRLSWVFEIFEV